jgi:enoyl-CoA hydratase/carnithine racemase
MSTDEPYILVDTTDRIGRILFNRPRQMNAFNNEMMQQTIDAVSILSEDEEVDAIVVQGAGRAFSAGFDLKASADRDLSSIDKVRKQMTLQFDFITCFWSAAKPTIAAVHGYCLAGAFELSLACDITIAAEDAVFGEPEVRFGTGAVAMLFPWVTGPKQAKEILLTGEDRISPADALRMGLINRIVPEREAETEAMKVARKISKASSVSVVKTKEAINRAYEIMGMRQALAAGLDIDVEINSTPSFEKTEFARIRKELGLQAAIAWRDGRFAEDS